MREYMINVSRIEELQTLNNKDELVAIFFRAKTTIVNGEKVLLARKDKSGKTEKFDEITTEEELERYKQGVFKYLY